MIRPCSEGNARKDDIIAAVGLALTALLVLVIACLDITGVF